LRLPSEDENNAKEKETANAISLSEGCAYTPVMVELRGNRNYTIYVDNLILTHIYTKF